jgi:hypothetical protein
VATSAIRHAAAMGRLAQDFFLPFCGIDTRCEHQPKFKTCTPRLTFRSEVFHGSACAWRFCAGQEPCKALASDCLLMRTPDKGPDRAAHARHSDIPVRCCIACLASGLHHAAPSTRMRSASLCASPRERLAGDSVRCVVLPCSRVQRRSARGRRKSKGVSQDAVEVRFPCGYKCESSPAGLSVASSSQARILAQQGAPVQAARGREGIRRHTTHTHHTLTHLVNKQARKHTQTQTGRYKMLIQPPEQHEYNVATAASLAFSVSVLSR